MGASGAAAEAGVPGRADAAGIAERRRETPGEARAAIVSPKAETPGDVVETELSDLSAVSLAALRRLDAAALRPSVRRIMEQVDRPRANLGGQDPPGRVD
jgi:hypothetical protein